MLATTQPREMRECLSGDLSAARTQIAEFRQALDRAVASVLHLDPWTILSHKLGNVGEQHAAEAKPRTCSRAAIS